MLKQKKKWATPKLIVLVRGKPEEAVLDSCKGVVLEGTEVVEAGRCAYLSELCWNVCSTQADS